MAKPPAVKENQLPTAESTAIPDFLKAEMAKDAGKGVSTAAEDNIVPLIYVLQANSPQVNKRDPAYVEGAEAGDLWIRGTGLPPIKGEEGLLVQPCYYYRNFVEWRLPRGNGMAEIHDVMPADAEAVPSPENPKKTIMMRKNGNQIVDTRNYILRAYLPNKKILPCGLPLSSTGHTVARQMMTLINMKSDESNKAPIWAGLYLLRTKQRTNESGTWDTLEVSDEGWVQTIREYNAGKELNEAFERGEKRADVPVEEPHDPSSDDAPM